MGKPLTQIAVENLKGFSKRREVPDGRISGLYLVVQPSGAKSWAVRYRFDGRQRKYTIGPHPAIDLATARKKALEALGQLAGSVDPSAEKKATRKARRAEAEAEADLVENVVAIFVARHVKPNLRDWRETERMLVKEVATRWRGRRLSQLTRAHIHTMLDEIIDRGAPIRANRVFGRFRQCAAGRSAAALSSAVPVTA